MWCRCSVIHVASWYVFGALVECKLTIVLVNIFGQKHNFDCVIVTIRCLVLTVWKHYCSYGIVWYLFAFLDKSHIDYWRLTSQQVACTNPSIDCLTLFLKIKCCLNLMSAGSRKVQAGRLSPQGLRVDPVRGSAPGTKGGPGEGERLRETQQFARLLPNHKTMIET